MNDKIMAGGNLDDITARLTCCIAVFKAIRADADAPGPSFCNALCGAIDLLESICRDRQGDIDIAEDYHRRETGQ